MISGTFHAMSQEWRYFSREKAIVHTLHVAQLTPTVTGQSVFITPVPPTGTGQTGFNIHPQTFPPITPYRGVNITQTKNNIPLPWIGAWDPTNGFVSQSGSSWATINPNGGYPLNAWSGTFFFDLSFITPSNLDGADTAEFFLPHTGGAFLYLGYNFDGGENGAANAAYKDVLSQFCRKADPLDMYLGPGYIPPPDDYADTFMTFKGHWELVNFGGGWGNFYEGNKSINAFGAAMGVEVGTIVDVSFMTWVGQRLYRPVTTNYLAVPWHTTVIRVGS